MQLGLVCALLVTYIAVENKTYEKEYDSLGRVDMGEEVQDVTIDFIPEPPKPVEKIPLAPVPDNIKKVDNEEEEDAIIFESTEDEPDVPLKLEDLVEVDVDEPIKEDVPFAVIENVPVFPGCTGTNDEKKQCLEKKMQKHVQRYFDADLANELGLAPGKKRIFLQFKIGKTGKIEDVQARAPHPRLKKEAFRIAEKLPLMEPGKQQGRPVRVKYTIPITFKVE